MSRTKEMFIALRESMNDAQDDATIKEWEQFNQSKFIKQLKPNNNE
jgi:hypothetical protein